MKVKVWLDDDSTIDDLVSAIATEPDVNIGNLIKDSFSTFAIEITTEGIVDVKKELARRFQELAKKCEV